MPPLLHDPSIFLDECTLHEIVLELSDRLRRHPRLRTPLDRVVGNRWHEFEDDFATFLSELTWLSGQQGGGIVALFEAFPDLGPEHVADACEVFMEAVLTVLPLHAAAAMTELAERVCDLALRALRPSSKLAVAIPLAERLKDADYALRVGAGLR